MSVSTHRYPEPDLLRSLAVVCMVVYHLAYDLAVFYGKPIDLGSTPWILLQRGTAGLFLFLVGLGFAISWDRSGRHGTRTYAKYLRRGLGLLACGLVVSLVTYLIDPATFIRFGILHMIGVSILLLPVFAPLRGWNALIGLLWIIAASLVLPMTGSWLTIPFGFPPEGFVSVDYFPLLPWFGVTLIGAGIGHLLYVQFPSWRKFLPPAPQWISVLTWPGRNALMLYLVHQPVLILGLMVVMGWPEF
jgi:uncharacterized membrane protein